MLFSIIAYSNDVNFNKSFTPEGASIEDIIEFNGEYYVSTGFSIFKTDDLDGTWEKFHEIEMSENIYDEGIEKLFSLGNDFFSFLSYINFDNEIYYNFDGSFEKYEAPPELSQFRIREVEQFKSGRTFIIAMDTTNFTDAVFEIYVEGINVTIEPLSTQNNIYGVSEDEDGRIWIVGDDIDIYDKENYTSIPFSYFISSDFVVANNTIYYSDGEQIIYYDYLNSEENYISFDENINYQIDEYDLMLQKINQNEIIMLCEDSDSNNSLVFKIDTESKTSEIVYKKAGNFNSSYLNENQQLLIGTGKDLLVANTDFSSLEEKSNGLMGFFSLLPHLTDNYFIGYNFFGGHIAIDRNSGSEFELFSEEGDLLRIIIGESGDNLISLTSELEYSDDGGNTWSPSNLIISEPEDGPPLYNLEYHNDEIYYAANHEIYNSIDNGENWNIIAELSSQSDYFITNLSVSSGGDLIISTVDGIYEFDGTQNQVALAGSTVSDAKKINHLGDEYLVAVYATEDDEYAIYRKNLSTDEEDFFPLDFDSDEPFDDLGLFFCLMDDGNVILSDFEGVKNYVLYINNDELEEIIIEDDVILSFRENNKGEYIGSGIRGNLYTIETTLSVDGEYELKIDKVYPNPANNFIQLKDIQNNTLVEITDNIGNSFESRYNSGIDISKVNPGMYFVKYQNLDGEIITSKFIKE
jgi:hypothetical protein